MAGRILRGVVVGALSLQGKELIEELTNAKSLAWDLTLLDSEESGGQITSAGDEALVIQPITAEAFVGIDVAFLQVSGLRHWSFGKALMMRERQSSI
jgi:hypothetical protein